MTRKSSLVLVLVLLLFAHTANAIHWPWPIGVADSDSEHHQARSKRSTSWLMDRGEIDESGDGVAKGMGDWGGYGGLRDW